MYTDPVVAAVADRRILITADDIAQFGSVSRDNIRREKQLSWIAKYTFLKWMIFDDHNVDDLLFLDADIVALSPCDSIFDDAGGVDLAVSPLFMERLFKQDETPLPPQDIAQNFQAMIDAKFPNEQKRINSGVMVLSGACLTADFRGRLLRMADTQKFVNEQSYISELLSGRSEISSRLLSSKYNFNARELKRVTASDSLELLSQIVFLHYVGRVKPWSRPLRNVSKITQMIWRHYETDAFDRSALLGKPNSLRRLARDWL